MGYDLFSSIVLDIVYLVFYIWVFFDPVLEWRQNEGLVMDHHIPILKIWSQEWIDNRQKPAVIESDFSITVGI